MSNNSFLYKTFEGKEYFVGAEDRGSLFFSRINDDPDYDYGFEPWSYKTYDEAIDRAKKEVNKIIKDKLFYREVCLKEKCFHYKGNSDNCNLSMIGRSCLINTKANRKRLEEKFGKCTVKGFVVYPDIIMEEVERKVQEE